MTTIPLTATVAPRQPRKAKVDAYDFVIGGQPVSWPRVTSIVGVLAKPALTNWLIKTNVEPVYLNSGGLYDEVKLSTPLSADEYIARLRQRVGTEREDQKILEAAGDIGTNVHKYIQWYLHTTAGQWNDVVEPVLHTPEARRATDAWLGWWTKQETEPLFIEERIYNEELEYGGTEDWKGYFNGALLDIDWKTSSGIYDEALLQNAAYAYARPYSGVEPVQSHGGMIVRLPKKMGDKADYLLKDWCRRISTEEQAYYFEMFKHCRALYRWMNGR